MARPKKQATRRRQVAHRPPNVSLPVSGPKALGSTGVAAEAGLSPAAVLYHYPTQAG